MASTTLGIGGGKTLDSFLRKAPPTDPTKKLDAVFFVSARDCNPNGDPDGNLPRQDQETGHGLISGVSVKRHIRDTALLLMGQEAGYGLYMSRKAILDYKLLAIHEQLGLETGGKKKDKKEKKASSEKDPAGAPETAGGDEPAEPPALPEDTEKRIHELACKLYVDTRWFGAVMASKMANSGQLRGPFQVGWMRSIDPIHVCDDQIGRLALQTEREAQTNDRLQTFGSRPRVPFGLYRGEIGFTPAFALATKLSGEDMKLFWECLVRMYENTRSSARDQVVVEQVIVFEHDGFLGRAPAHKLLRMVQVKRKDETKPARDIEDYSFPTEKEIQDKIDAAGYAGVKVHFLL